METPSLPPPTEESDEPFESETDFIKFLHRACSQRNMTVDYSDDCAHLYGQTALVTTDTIVENVHFSLPAASPYQIGRQLAVVNLSDMAGSGAKPTWALLNLQLPQGRFGGRLRRLCDGFLDELSQHQTPLVGGNCTRAQGPLSLTDTIGGCLFGRYTLRRDGSQVGNRVYVSGILGAAAVSLTEDTPEHTIRRHQWRPHLQESKELCQLGDVNAMMDISDGLIVDAGRLAQVSGVAIHLDTSLLPLVNMVDQNAAKRYALFGGEDYVLLFTLPSVVEAPTWAIEIGRIQRGSGVYLDGCLSDSRGFDHFRTSDRPDR